MLNKIIADNPLYFFEDAGFMKLLNEKGSEWLIEWGDKGKSNMHFGDFVENKYLEYLKAKEVKGDK